MARTATCEQISGARVNGTTCCGMGELSDLFASGLPAQSPTQFKRMFAGKGIIIATTAGAQTDRCREDLTALGFAEQGSARNPNTGNIVTLWAWFRPTRSRRTA